MRSSFGMLAIAGTTSLIASTLVFGQSDAPKVIESQAVANYVNLLNGVAHEALSNTAIVRVKPVSSYLVSDDVTQLAIPGSHVCFSHRIHNTGNRPETYLVEAYSDDLLDPMVYQDNNSNGILDQHEPHILSLTLQDGDFQNILACGYVPATAEVTANEFTSQNAGGLIIDVDVTAISSSFSVQRQDTAIIVNTLPFRMAHTASPSCPAEIQSDGKIAYRLDITNWDQLSSNFQTIQIDDESESGNIIMAKIPANTEIIAGSPISYSPIEGSLIVQERGAVSTQWISYENWTGATSINRIGLFLPSTIRNNIPVTGTSGFLEYEAQLRPSTTSGTNIYSQTEVDYELDNIPEFISNQVCSKAPTSAIEATLSFLKTSSTARQEIDSGSKSAPLLALDSDFADSGMFILNSAQNYHKTRDGIYIEVTLSELNLDSTIADTQLDGEPIIVEVSSFGTDKSVFVEMLETGTNTSVFRSTAPIELNDVGQINQNAVNSPFSSKSTTGLSVCSPRSPTACVLDSGQGDKLSATLSNKGVSVTLFDQVVVTPYGTVFDASSFTPVSGATVTLYDSNGQVAEDPDSPGTAWPAQITNSNGQYFIPSLAPGDYYIDVQPPVEYIFPSTVAALTFFGQYSVQTSSYGVDGFTGQGNGFFTSSSVDMPSIIDIPIDPVLTNGQISLTKNASPENVSYGDRVTYTLEISNASDATLYQTTVDDIPSRGLKIIQGTALYDGAPIDAIQSSDGLKFELGTVDPQSNKTLTYQMLVGPSTPVGTAVNAAQVNAETIGGGSVARSPISRAAIVVRDDGVMSNRGLIIGVVWIDSDQDGVKDTNEHAVPGAKIWLEDGTWVVTDSMGRYSLFGVKSGTHVARLDPASIPDGLIPFKSDNRTKGSSGLRLVDMTAGQIHRANFPLACVENCIDDSSGNILPALAADLEARQGSINDKGILDEAFGFDGLLTRNGLAQRRFQHANAGPDGDSSNGVITDRGISGRALSNLNYESTQLEENPQEVVNNDIPDPEKIASKITEEQAKTGTWLWPQGDISRDGRFVAVIPAGITPLMKVNGKSVSDGQLGAQIENKSEQAQVVAWYGVELQQGLNEIKVVGIDPFGNERVMAIHRFTKPGVATDLMVTPTSSRVSADGQTETQVNVRLLDTNGVKVSGQRFARILSTEGKLIGQDVRASEEGLQIRLTDGEGMFRIQSPSKPGRVKISVELDDGMREVNEIDFVTPSRDFMALGVLQTGSKFTGDNDFQSTMHEMLPREKIKKNSRAAFFATGRIKGDAILTLAYDTEKNREDYLLRDLDPQRYYPIYGDSSSKGYTGQSRSKGYAKFEKNGFAAMWGDFVTDRNSGESLGASRRTLTGANAVFERGPLTVQAFTAEVKRATKAIRIRGNGTALLFTLPDAPLEPLTDILTLEVRDQNNPGLIIEETELQRFRDYVLDTDTGALTMRRVVPTFDADGNPVYLRATYDTTERLDGDWATGVRAKISGKRGRVWANYTDENDPDRQRQMAAVGIEVGLGKGNSRAWIEGGWMESDTIASAYAFRSGIEADLKHAKIRADFNQAERGFDNLDSPVANGRQELRVQAQLKSQGWLSLKSSYFDSRDMTNNNRRGGGDIIAEARKGNLTFSFGPRFTYTEDDRDGSDDQATVVARVRHNGKYAGRTGSVYVQAEHSINQDAALQAEVGGELQIAKGTKLYGRYTFIDELPDVTYAPGLTSEFNDARQNKTVFGIQTDWLKNTTAYGEWRIDGALDAGTAETAYGIRADWEIRKDLHFTPAIESVKTVEGENSEDSVAVSLGFLDKRNEDARRTMRLETRLAEVGDYYGLHGGWAQKIAPTLSGAIRVRGTWDEPANDKASRAISYALGVARRPENGHTDIIAMYQFEHERGPGEFDDRDVHLISTHANRPFQGRNEISGRFAMKWENSGDIDTSIYLLDSRFLHNYNKWIDFSVQGGYRSAFDDLVSEYSYGAAIGFTPLEGLRLVTGYNAEGFRDRDLDPDYSNAKGLYWGVTATFDESWFGWLKPK